MESPVMNNQDMFFDLIKKNKYEELKSICTDGTPFWDYLEEEGYTGTQ